MSWGRFPNSPKLDHITPREAVLLDDFHYHAPNGSIWTAQAGLRLDGTSVPSWLWSVFRESPFTGAAAWPAVHHDAGCKGLVLVDGSPLAPAGLRDGRVHLTFYQGIRAQGGSALKAWMFYRAVWAYGMARGGYTR